MIKSQNLSSLFHKSKIRMIFRRSRIQKPKSRKMQWEEAPDLHEDIDSIVVKLKLDYIKTDRIFCFRTTGSSSRAYARIWSFPKIFQRVLQIEPAYVIEMVCEHTGRIDNEKKIRILIHELLHIPKNFSGSLLPHRYGNKTIDKEVNRLYKELVKL